MILEDDLAELRAGLPDLVEDGNLDRRHAGADVSKQGGDAPAPILGAPRPRGEHHHARRVGAGDETLGAVDDPALLRLVPVRLEANRLGIRARVRLGEAEAGDQFAARHPGQIALLLLLGAEAGDREGGERVLHDHVEAEPSVPARQFLHHRRLLDGRDDVAAVLLGDFEPEQTDPGAFLDQFMGIFVRVKTASAR